MRVAVVLPAYNECESIADMIGGVRAVDKSYDIYVVDSASSDSTRSIAESNGARIIRLDVRGKGIAIAKAFRDLDYDSIVMLDSDMSYSPNDIPMMLNGLKGADVVVGSRFRGTIAAGAMCRLNRAGNIMLTRIASALYKIPITDVCSGFWAFSNLAYRHNIDIDAKHFTLEVNFYVECVDKKLRLAEVPIRYEARRGISKLNILHGFEIFWYLIWNWLM